MTKDKDYYNILGLDKNASKEDIKKAYKKLAKKYHPDLNKDNKESEQKFKDISEAASVLGDDEKRKQYDQLGTDYQQFTGHGFDFGDFGFGDSASFDIGDIFDRFFGGSGFGGFSGRRRGPSRGNDLRYDMEMELEDAAFGAEKEITVPRLEPCTKCDGTGAHSKSDIETCPDCEGNGAVRRTQRTPFGMFSTTQTCRKCRGTGKYIRKECEECDGTGLVKKTRKIKNISWRAVCSSKRAAQID